jgi:cold shock CspA family protein
MTKPRKQRRQPETGGAVSDWVAPGQWVTPAFLQVMPSPKRQALRRVGTISTLCPRKNMGLLIDGSSGDNALFTMDDIAPADRPTLKEGDQVTYVSLIGADGLCARQLQRDSADIPPPPSEILMARGWR